MAYTVAPKYEVVLYLNGQIIGDVRKLAMNLKWVRRRTKAGADEIDFTLNDVLFNEWLGNRNTDINTVLKPYALECRIVRNGVSIVGGFLATMPSYSPNGTSANLDLKFDGFLNLLAGAYIRPIGTVRGAMNSLISRFISEADTRAKNAGKAFGFKAGNVTALANIEHTFDNYKSTKEWLTDRCDNVTGAGPFDIIFDADKTWNLYSEALAGDIIMDWVARYPANISQNSITQISASEVSGFASAVIGIGSGEVSSNANENTAITSYSMNANAVKEFGFCEEIMQDSSTATQSLLDANTNTKLATDSKFIWEPEVEFSGRQVEPKPSGNNKIWICDVITIENDEDLTGMTDGMFRVNELEVSVSSSNAETIKPTLERYKG